MKKITETQKYAILWLNHIRTNSKDIAKALKINEQQVLETIEANVLLAQQSNSTSMRKLMITESIGQKHQVAVMTKAASEVADAAKQKIIINNTDNKKSFIYKPTGH